MAVKSTAPPYLSEVWGSGVISVYRWSGLLSLLERERARRLVAELGLTVELDRTRVDEAHRVRPFVTVCGEVGEGLALKVYKRLLDHRLEFAVTTLHIHHHRCGDTTSP